MRTKNWEFNTIFKCHMTISDLSKSFILIDYIFQLQNKEKYCFLALQTLLLFFLPTLPLLLCNHSLAILWIPFYSLIKVYKELFLSHTPLYTLCLHVHKLYYLSQGGKYQHPQSKTIENAKTLTFSIRIYYMGFGGKLSLPNNSF